MHFGKLLILMLILHYSRSFFNIITRVKCIFYISILYLTIFIVLFNNLLK